MASYYGELGRDIVADPIENRGYNELFDPPVQSDYECPICTMCLRDPVQTACGHRFCKSCIYHHVRTVSATCPDDNKPLEQSHIFDDNYAKREIDNFTVKCRTVKNGEECPWKGELQRLEDHLEICRKVKVNCPQCSKKIKREMLPSHDKECPKAPAHCEFAPYGCKWVGLRSDLSVHLQNDLAPHLSLLLPALSVLFPNGREKSKGAASKSETTSSGNLEELSRKVARNEESINRTMEKIKQMERNVSEVTARDDAAATMRNSMGKIAARSCNGKYLWYITDYAALVENARQGISTSLQSAPFYTAFNGYKLCLCLRINPNIVSGPYISLSLHVMQSEWDDDLKWPFPYRFSLSIMDRSDDGEYKRHISETLVTRPNLLAFQRPTTLRNPKGYGYVEFARLETLQERQFVKNDCLLVRVQVYK